MPRVLKRLDRTPLAGAGRLVRWHRERIGWTQDELATRLGISQPACCHIERGHAGQAITALALFLVGAPRAGALIAGLPRSEHARKARAEARRLERAERRRAPREPIELPPEIERAAWRERDRAARRFAREAVASS